MAGSIDGTIDVRVGDGVISQALMHQEAFTTLKDFFDAKYTRIASNFGSGGTGLDYHDGANPSGENAFCVWRAASAADPFNILLQVADATAFGTAPGNPGLIDGGTTDGVGLMVAMREDGTSPWDGGTANAGADTKAATVWAAGGDTLHTFGGRSNATGGNFAANKENTHRCAGDYVSTGTFGRFHVIGDDDGFLIADDVGDNGSYKMTYCGAYTARAGLTLTAPLVAIFEPNGANVWTLGEPTTFGSVAGNTSNEGGILGRVLADNTRGLSIADALTGSAAAGAGIYDAAFQPNNQLATVELDGAQIALIRRELNQGLCGFIPTALMSFVYGVANNETNTAATRAYIAETSVNTRKWSIPWDGGAVPGSNNTREGRVVVGI